MQIEGEGTDGSFLDRYLDECRGLTIEGLRALVPEDTEHTGHLYELMLNYPLRDAKGLRPALAIAACRALGGRLAAVLPTALVLELYHNAFLIHDDIEDDSELRRNVATLHKSHGVPIAVNVGDGMLALALTPLLDNMRTVGMGKALRVLETIGAMARASAEGQAIELDWIRNGCWSLTDAAYLRMIYKKSAWYTFLTPMTIGAMLADTYASSATAAALRPMRWYAILIGLAFQIQDDLLNLQGEDLRYGKEIGGDLWEGKHTLILIHAMREASSADREQARTILRKRRPNLQAASPDHPAEEYKTEADIRFLCGLIERGGSIEYAREAAVKRARYARRMLDACAPWMGASVHRDFLEGLTDFVVERTH